MGNGFITYQGRKDYRASYGNHNQTVRSFKTMAEAKEYLRKQGIQKANYDSGNTDRLLNISKPTKKRVVRRTSTPFGIPRNMFRF